MMILIILFIPYFMLAGNKINSQKIIILNEKLDLNTKIINEELTVKIKKNKENKELKFNTIKEEKIPRRDTSKPTPPARYIRDSAEPKSVKKG